MIIKYNKAFTEKLERILVESEYIIRYEKGNFHSGWCLLEQKRVVILNKFLNDEGRINTLMELIPQLKINYDNITLQSQKLYDEIIEEANKMAIEATKNNDSAEDA